MKKFAESSKNNGNYKENGPPRLAMKQFLDPVLDNFGASRGAVERPFQTKWRQRVPFFIVFFDVKKEEANS